MRQDGRANDQAREMKLTVDYIKKIPGSVLIEQGDTRLLCTANYEQKVPPFLKFSGKGWVTAEYAMLPGSTGSQRSQRERQKMNNRNVEIQRFISRALRTTFDMKTIDGKTIYIDTDVLQADGSTRCTAINGGMLVLFKALRYLVFENLLRDMPPLRWIAATSIGVKGGDILVDMNYVEDSSADVDINIVSSEKGEIIEVQAFCEGRPAAKDIFQKVIDMGIEKNLEIISNLKKIVNG
ncbi:MAG TPA: ribonuclease PH [Candidatus Deferrimicrobium sp.]|nr:ribonuclease PH [Candidatus Deferrimicrobium sp.]